MINKYLASILISILFFISYNSVSRELYRSHQTRGDLTAYAQGMWNTLKGNFMASTYNYSVHNYYDQEFREINSENSNILGIHFNPILLALLPFYALYPHPETLLILQALLVAGGGCLVYVLSRRILQHNLLSLSLQFAYLIYFATVSATLSQFHAYTLALFFGPLLILASTAKNNLYYYLSLGLFLLVQENTSLVAFFFGLYMVVNRATRKRGAATMILSLLYFVSTIYYIIPALSPYNFYLFSGIYGSQLGGNITEMVKNSFLHPSKLLQSTLTGENIVYLRNLLIGIMPFALLSPLVLLVAFSSLAQNLLSSSLGLKTQQMHYESGSVAFLFYALILGLSFFLTRTSIGKSRYGVTMCLLILLVTTGVSYKQFTSFRFNPSLLNISLYTNRNAEMDSLIEQIPDKASVSTQDYLSAHLSTRAELYQFPVYADRVDYLLLSKGDAVWPLTPEEHASRLTAIRTNPKFETISESAHFVLFARVARPSQSHN